MKNIAVFTWGVLIGLGLYHFNFKEENLNKHPCPYEDDPYHIIKHDIYYLCIHEAKEKTDSITNLIDFSKLPSPNVNNK
jgi:hypothetical protein